MENVERIKKNQEKLEADWAKRAKAQEKLTNYVYSDGEMTGEELTDWVELVHAAAPIHGW